MFLLSEIIALDSVPKLHRIEFKNNRSCKGISSYVICSCLLESTHLSLSIKYPILFTARLHPGNSKTKQHIYFDMLWVDELKYPHYSTCKTLKMCPQNLRFFVWLNVSAQWVEAHVFKTFTIGISMTQNLKYIFYYVLVTTVAQRHFV